MDINVTALEIPNVFNRYQFYCTPCHIICKVFQKYSSSCHNNQFNLWWTFLSLIIPAIFQCRYGLKIPCMLWYVYCCVNKFSCILGRLAKCLVDGLDKMLAKLLDNLLPSHLCFILVQIAMCNLVSIKHVLLLCFIEILYRIESYWGIFFLTRRKKLPFLINLMVIECLRVSHLFVWMP